MELSNILMNPTDYRYEWSFVIKYINLISDIGKLICE